jgi:hypothetical protein
MEKHANGDLHIQTNVCERQRDHDLSKLEGGSPSQQLERDSNILELSPVDLNRYSYKITTSRLAALFKQSKKRSRKTPCPKR